MSRDVLPLPIGVLPEIASDRVERGTAGKRIDITEAEIHAVILILVRRVVVFTEPPGGGNLDCSASRGNASEIMALAGYSSVTKGPESTSSSADALQAARELALHTGAAVLVTGRTDYSTDGRQVISTENGHAMMSRVTGVGCSMGALAAACAAVSSSPLQAAVSTAVLMGIAGEMAFEQSPVPGSFAVSLLDSLYSLSPEEVARRARILPF